MQQIINGLKRSASTKALVIGALILILLIPVSMIKSVVHDRSYVHNEARADIMRSWGGEQLLTGPILVLQLNGADSLRISPLGDTTKVTMNSTWPSPSFVGNYLPEHREVSDSGFSAAWQVSSLGRSLPSQWTGKTAIKGNKQQMSFGVDFYQPVSLYRLSLRAAKYAVLFIGLTFVAYFLFEVMAGLRLHPLQYLLVGFANALFYLLLLSLAEHIGFGWAYLASSGASISLVAGYSVAILGRESRGLLMAIILAGLYSFLYMTLKAETYALLAGALGLWITLAIIMFLTRRIDWYAQGGPPGND